MNNLLAADPFVYDRNYVPLFFAPRQDMAVPLDIARYSREFFRKATLAGASEHTVMSNGMTLGEWAMYVLTHRHTVTEKRRKGGAVSS